MKELKSTPRALVIVAGFLTQASAYSKPSSSSLRVIQLPIMRDKNAFIAEIEVGTPAQKVNVTIDTGNAFTWVLGPDANICQHPTNNQSDGACSYNSERSFTFNSSLSSSFKLHKSDTFATYRNGHYIQGFQNSESLTLNNITVPHVQMSMIQNSTLNTGGILGLGYPNPNSPHGKHASKQHTFLESMLKEGAIHHKAYSLYLDDSEAGTGTILFGGMDVEKFQGSMKELPIVPHTDSKGHKYYQALQVMMTSLDLGRSRTVAVNTAAILDPSSRISYLPKIVFEEIYELFQDSESKAGKYVFQEISHGTKKVRFVNCKIRESLSDKIVNFGFGGLEGAKIEVPVRDLILKAPGCNEDAISTMSGQTGPPLIDKQCPCYLAIDQSPMPKSPKTTELTVLGDAFLRQAYMVCDLQNNIIGMAPRKFNSKSSKIVEFGKGMKSISRVDGKGKRKGKKGAAASRFEVTIPTLMVSVLLVLAGGMMLFS